ncbi:MAG: DEAD/DEAH box helicase [Candidatus Helarchaeota archaeon]
MDFVSHWMIAPEAIEKRTYQQDISNTCFNKNTLVILPTALGKTIIALLTAVKRLDIYPWAKILFLAPTRPLVLQHFATFSQFLIFDENKVKVLTGKNVPNERISFWEQAQFIFATPQVVKNDLEKERYDLGEVALLIFDESHRARMNYAYTKIAKTFVETNDDPLILALTASPGKNKERILELSDNLYIEVIEFRTENDPDVKKYIHSIQMEYYKLDLPKEYITIKQILKEILQDYLKKLRQMRLLQNKSIQYISKTDLLNLGNKIRSFINNGHGYSNKGYYFSALVVQSACVSLMHALELLTTQDIDVFLNFIIKLERNSIAKINKYTQKITSDPRFQKLIAITEYYANVCHTKLNKLRDIILDELKTNKNSRIIVFTQYRDTASKIVEKLQTLPDVHPIRFIGQATKDEDRGLSQKEQAEILDEFRFGKYNILVATCIAEEGLDIPSVELVVFYEPIPSEIRYIQRRGRTGRKRVGKVKILITKETLDEAFFYASLKREKQMRTIVSQLKKEINVKIQRTPLKKPKKTNLTSKVIKSQKNYMLSNETKSKPLNKTQINSKSMELEINNSVTKNPKSKNIMNNTQIFPGFRPKTTKGLSKAIKWVIRRTNECDNGNGVNIEELLKISELDDFNNEIIKVAISKLIEEGVLFQPNSCKISVA